MARKSSKRQLSPSQIAARKARNQRRNARRKLRRRQGGSSLMATAMDNSQSGFSGHGDYKKRVKGRGGYVGDLLGGLGGKLGSWIDNAASSLFSGHGDYKDELTVLSSHDVDQNSLLCGTQPPEIKNKGQAFIFRHREYVQDVTSSVAFNNSSFIINPGNITLFPWLSSLAAAFEEFEVLGMIAEFKPLISLTSTNANGAVVFATEYNVLKPNFSSKIQMENYEYATSCAPYQSMFHAIECAPNQTALGSAHRYVNFGALPANADARLYNLGNLQLALQGQSSATTVGEFWITYEIAFYKPLFSVGLGLNAQVDHFGYQTTGGTNVCLPNSGVAPTPLFSTLGCTISGGGLIQFPSRIQAGYFLVSISLADSGNFANSCNITEANAVANSTVSGTQTVSLVKIWNSQAGTAQAAYLPGEYLPGTYNLACAGGAANSTILMLVKINAPGNIQAQFQPTLSTTSHTTISTVDVLISQTNAGLV